MELGAYCTITIYDPVFTSRITPKKDGLFFNSKRKNFGHLGEEKNNNREYYIRS